jgi:hypothetical protein
MREIARGLRAPSAKETAVLMAAAIIGLAEVALAQKNETTRILFEYGSFSYSPDMSSIARRAWWIGLSISWMGIDTSAL